MRVRRRWVSVSAILAAFLIGCGGRVAHPIQAMQPGDLDRDCSSYANELAHIERETIRVLEGNEQLKGNLAMGVLTAVFLFPALYLDLSTAGKQEARAYCLRYERLRTLATQKDCALPHSDMTRFCDRFSASANDAVPTP